MMVCKKSSGKITLSKRWLQVGENSKNQNYLSNEIRIFAKTFIMKRNYILLISALLLIINVFAQHPNVMISNANSPEEPSITIDPNNTQRLVAGANINNYYYSNDGGLTWQIGQLYSSQYGVWGDPCVKVDNAGNYYFFHLSNPQSGSWIDRIVCQKSTDGGVTWNEGSYMGLNGNKAQDKEWVDIDRNNGNIYSTWTQFDNYGSSNPAMRSNIMFSKSVDDGETWSAAQRINEVDGDCIDSDNTVEGAVPAVGINGEIYVAWAGPLGIVFDKSLDQGETWLENDIFVTEFPGGWDYGVSGISRCNGLPVTCCDLSNGPNHGTIYINWTDQRYGESDTDVWVIKSTDAGETWSEPIRVNDDPPGRQQFFTWMTIDQVTGFVYFVFYDRRNYSDNNTDVFMAVSTDGCETFSNFKVSETPFLPSSWVFFGDYTNVAAHNNVVRPIWTRLDDSQLSVWTALIDPTIAGIEETTVPKIPFALEQNYPNPFNESTHFSFKIKKSSTISLKIFDLFGRVVATLIDNKFVDAGVYFEHFNASSYQIPPGVYYFSLMGEDQNQVRKMIVE